MAIEIADLSFRGEELIARTDFKEVQEGSLLNLENFVNFTGLISIPPY